MITIVRNFNGMSLYLFADGTHIHAAEDRIIVGSPPALIIGDLNERNASIYTVKDAPDDWAGEKYFYREGGWLLNPDYVEPVIEQEP